MTTTELGEVVKNYLRTHPDIASRRISRWINEKYPQWDTEKIRTIIRYYRGQLGATHRINSTEEFFNQSYDLPSPSKYDSSDFHIKEAEVLVISDLQFPFQDNEAIRATIKWGKNRSQKHKKIEAVLINGDALDVYQLSTFSRNPKERDLREEIEDFQDFLELLQQEFGVPIYWKYGNHEERFERHLFNHSEELAKLDIFTLDVAVDVKQYNCTVIKDKRTVRIGHLSVLHGHEFRGGMSIPVNPARWLFTKTKASAMCGDRHQTSEHTEKDINGKLITCWSTGCLCGLRPLFQPNNNWNHGFAYVRNDGDTFRVLNLRIENGIVY